MKVYFLIDERCDRLLGDFDTEEAAQVARMQAGAEDRTEQDLVIRVMEVRDERTKAGLIAFIKHITEHPDTSDEETAAKFLAEAIETTVDAVDKFDKEL